MTTKKVAATPKKIPAKLTPKQKMEEAKGQKMLSAAKKIAKAVVVSIPAEVFEATDKKARAANQSLAGIFPCEFCGKDDYGPKTKSKAAQADWTKKHGEGTCINKAPDTPLTKLLTSKGFVYAQSQPVDEQNTAHGYTHEDGSAAMFVHANTSDKVSARWIVIRNGKQMEGKTAKELAVALIKPESLPANVLSALTLLRKVTKCSYDIASLAGDEHYATRVQLLKKLKGVDKILVKESGVNNLAKTFHAVLKATNSTQFIESCVGVYNVEQKVDRAIARVERAEIKELSKRTGGAKPVLDGKPVLPGVKKLSAKQQASVDAQTKAGLRIELASKTGVVPPVADDVPDDPKVELAAKIAAKRRQEEYTPLAVPRPEAQISVNLDDVCILEDPNNGISLLCLEKPNSQGAICVYNNGSRVAAGVVPTEVLVTLRPILSEDLIRDVNQLLHPMTAGVIVTPVAETHLTAVLAHCKEKIEMTTETVVKTKKFAPPAGAPKKVTAEKSAPKTPAKTVKPAVKTVVKAVVTKPAAKKVASKSSKAVATVRTGGADAAKKIVILTKENPYRAGTVAHDTYELARKSKTVGDFRTAVATDTDKYRGTALPWAVKQGHIKYA